MFLKNIKAFFKKKEKLEPSLVLDNNLREVFKNLLAPMEKTVVYLVLEKIKAKNLAKNNFGYKVRYKILPLAISIFLIFTLTGVSLNSNYGGASSPTFSAGLKSATPPSENNGPVVGDASKDTILIAPSVGIAETSSVKQKSKIQIFFEKIWEFLLKLWE